MKVKKVPMRRCAGCMESKPKKELIRIIADENGFSVDSTGKAQGRGVYLCPNTECFNTARKKKSLSRSLKITSIPEDALDRLYTEISAYYEEKN